MEPKEYFLVAGSESHLSIRDKGDGVRIMLSGDTSFEIQSIRLSRGYVREMIEFLEALEKQWNS